MENEDKNKLKNKAIETYTGDMSKVLESGSGGIIKKIIHEEEEHEAEKKNFSPESKKNKFFMSISGVLIILALATFVFLGFFNKKINIISVAPQMASIIFTDQTDFLPIDGFTKDQITNTVLNQINNLKVKVGGIDGIYLTENKNIISFQRFISLIEGNLDINQINSIQNNFLIGGFNEDNGSVCPISKPVSTNTVSNCDTANKSGDFFILLKVSSFADMFPIMQNWENKMLYDLHGFLGVDISADTNYLFTKDFEDGIVANKNARILKDNDGNIVLMYVFINDTSILITNSEANTKEIIVRLNSSQIKK